MRARIGASTRAAYGSLAASLWLGVRLQGLGLGVVGAVAGLAVVERALAAELDAGLVGLGLAYALSVTGVLNGLLSSFTETEKELVSVERIGEYTRGAPQEETDGKLAAFPGWPSGGQVAFDSVTLRYAPGAQPALSRLTFRVEEGERVGIVGRTGPVPFGLLPLPRGVRDV